MWWTKISAIFSLRFCFNSLSISISRFCAVLCQATRHSVKIAIKFEQTIKHFTHISHATVMPMHHVTVCMCVYVTKYREKKIWSKWLFECYVLFLFIEFYLSLCLFSINLVLFVCSFFSSCAITSNHTKLESHRWWPINLFSLFCAFCFYIYFCRYVSFSYDLNSFSECYWNSLFSTTVHIDFHTGFWLGILFFY